MIGGSPFQGEGIFVRDSLLAKELDGKIQCNVCERRCVLRSGAFGWCRTRENRAGRLITLIYGSVSALDANPIEKKPFYHFYPGTKALTAGSWSCNFGCPWCQDWDIAKVAPPATGDYVSPERFLELIKETGCQGSPSRLTSQPFPWNGLLTCFAWRDHAAYTTPTLPTAT